ncbi:MAG TPA: glycoside hydrolase family 16 protein [Nocardioides sp.]|nr:glycoside hydrolase family 16 protein [Nocardioides sp.]
MTDSMRPHFRLRRAVPGAVAVLALAAAALALPGTAAPAVAGRPTSGDSCGATVLKADGTPWTCTFTDNFSDTKLDTTKWTVGVTATSGFVMGKTCFTADNVVEKGGELRLTTRNVGQPFTCSSPYGSFTTSYTGAHVGTVGKWAQAYGRYDVRARYPKSGSGLHGGYWLYPAKLTYGAWPASGEIDVAEWWSSVPTTVLPTLHYSGSTQADSGSACTVADPTVWHDYALVWEPTQMQFSIDGQVCFTDSWTPNSPLVAPQPFDQPFNIIMNMAVDDTTNNAVTSTTTLPATYEVDYVKAWK